MKPSIFLTAMFFSLLLLNGCSRLAMTDPEDTSYISENPDPTTNPTMSDNVQENPNPENPYQQQMNGQETGYQQTASASPDTFSDPNQAYGFAPTDPSFSSAPADDAPSKNRTMASASSGDAAEVPFSMTRKPSGNGIPPNYGAMD